MSALVLLHGFLGSPNSFAEVLRELDSSPSVFVPPLYGHGADVPLNPAYSFEDEVKRLAGLITRRCGPARTHLVGYSMGARLALSLLVQAPMLFHSATLVSGRDGLRTPEERQQRWLSDQRWVKRLGALSLGEFLDEWMQQPLFASLQHVAPERLSEIRRERSRHEPQALALALQALSLAKMPSFRSELMNICVPVTIASGELDAKFVQLGKELAAGMPQAKTLVVHGAGHQLLIERPDAVAAAIREGMEHAQRYMEKGQSI